MPPLEWMPAPLVLRLWGIHSFFQTRGLFLSRVRRIIRDRSELPTSGKEMRKRMAFFLGPHFVPAWWGTVIRSVSEEASCDTRYAVRAFDPFKWRYAQRRTGFQHAEPQHASGFSPVMPQNIPRDLSRRCPFEVLEPREQSVRREQWRRKRRRSGCDGGKNLARTGHLAEMGPVERR